MNSFSITLSKEHESKIPEIKEIFKDLNPDINAGYIRCSENELPMAVIIFISESIISGVTWDIIKSSLKLLFAKFPKSKVSIRFKTSIIFSINANFEVNATVPPNEKLEYAKIKNIDDLRDYINTKTNNI